MKHIQETFKGTGAKISLIPGTPPHVHAGRQDAENPILKSKMRFRHPVFGQVTIEFHEKGLPVRHVITHGKRTASGAFPSAKMGRSMPWEAWGERNLIQDLECRPDCAGFLVQPHRVTWSADGIPYTYTPDAIAEIMGCIWVFEAKEVYPGSQGAADVPKYRMVEAIYEWLGWRFDIVTSARLRVNAARLHNLHDLCAARFTAYDLAAELIVWDFLANAGGTAMLCSLTHHLGSQLNLSETNAKDIIFAMAVRRIVRFDLEKRIRAVSPVHLISPRAPAMTLLNFWEKANG